MALNAADQALAAMAESVSVCARLLRHHRRQVLIPDPAEVVRLQNRLRELGAILQALADGPQVSWPGPQWLQYCSLMDQHDAHVEELRQMVEAEQAG